MVEDLVLGIAPWERHRFSVWAPLAFYCQCRQALSDVGQGGSVNAGPPFRCVSPAHAQYLRELKQHAAVLSKDRYCGNLDATRQWIAKALHVEPRGFICAFIACTHRSTWAPMTIHNRHVRALHMTGSIEQVELPEVLGETFQLLSARLGDRFGQRLAPGGVHRWKADLSPGMVRSSYRAVLISATRGVQGFKAERTSRIAAREIGLLPEDLA
jgi:hypothetical protein